MTVDICIYGGTAAGVIAAITAAQEGRSVVLVNSSSHLGGMTSGGLGATDTGNIATIGGLAKEFYRRVSSAYDREEQWQFEPHVAEQILQTWIDQPNIRVLNDRWIKRVEKQGARLMVLETQYGEKIEARIFIDTSYEGDLMARAGVRWTILRESNAQYGESLNGVRDETPEHQFHVKVDPYVRLGNPKSGLLPFIQLDDVKQPGDESSRLQSYNFRLCLTKEPDNHIPITPARSYNLRKYKLLARYLKALVKTGFDVKFSDLFLIVKLPNGKTDFNNNGGFSTDYIGANWNYPDADYETRVKIWQDHIDYTRGLIYFLSTDECVPTWIQKEMQQWGLCRDEFTDAHGWPHQLYVREARRMVGEYVMTQANCDGSQIVKDSIGMGSYNIDSHNCQRIVQGDGVKNEGDIQERVNPYPISYRAITPKASECNNLLVPVCLSASHIAHSSIRMEPVFMILAQSAGLAACRALDENQDVQGIDVERMQRDLSEMGQILTYDASKDDKAQTEWLHAPHLYL